MCCSSSEASPSCPPFSDSATCRAVQEEGGAWQGSGSRFSAVEIAAIFSRILEDPVIAIPFYVVEPIFLYIGRWR